MGTLKTKRFSPFYIAFLCFFLLFTTIVEGSDVIRNKKDMSFSDYADVSVKLAMPFQDVYDKMLELITNSTSMDEYIVARRTHDAMLKGIVNSSYTNAVDLPLTRYVLGNLEIDVLKLCDIFYATQTFDIIGHENRYDKMEEYREKINNSTSQYGGGSSYSLKLNQLEGADKYTAHAYQINEFLKAAQDSFAMLMQGFPIVVLLMMFIFQYVSMAWVNLIKPETMRRVSVLALTPRFFFFMFLILTYKTVFSWLVAFSNYATLALVPLDVQEHVMKSIIEQMTISVTGESIGWIGSTMRSLAFIALKTLLITRDVFLAVHLLIGGICISIGFFTSYENHDPIHQYVTAWIEGFAKLLMWGPLSAVAITFLGIVTIISSIGVLSVTAITVVSLCFLYAAANIPNLAEKMSSLALQGMLIGMLPHVKRALDMGVKGGVGVVGALIPGGKIKDSIAEKFTGRKMADTNASFVSGKNTSWNEKMKDIRKRLKQAGFTDDILDSMGEAELARAFNDVRKGEERDARRV